MTENLEPAEDAAARATKKMMQGAGLQSAEELTIDPAGLQAIIGALFITNLALATFMIEAGLKLDSIAPRMEMIANSIPWGRSARIATELDTVAQWLRNNAPAHLKEQDRGE
jgi:hypothetical protein